VPFRFWAKYLEAAGDEPKKMASVTPGRKRFGTVEEHLLEGTELNGMTALVGRVDQHSAGLAAWKSKDTLSSVDAQSIFPVHCRIVNIF
jgi:hypothetical protein